MQITNVMKKQLHKFKKKKNDREIVDINFYSGSI